MFWGCSNWIDRCNGFMMPDVGLLIDVFDKILN